MTQGNSLNFAIEGGHKLKGEISVNTSKNGAMAVLCASLLNKGTTTIHHMPKIEEVHRLVEVFESIGVHIEWRENTLIIKPPETYKLDALDADAARKTRSIIMFIGPMLHRFNSFLIPQSGGCKLGSRTVRPHFFALEKYGVDIRTEKNWWHISHKGLSPTEVIMYESGDTATQNAITAAAGIDGTSVIKYASANYMVQELCFFLQKLGVETEGIGTTTLTIHGKKNIEANVEYSLSEDPTDAMFFLSAAIVTNSSITIKRIPIDFLELELLVLEKMGFKYEVLDRYASWNTKTKLVDIKTHPSKLVAPPEKIHARPYPGINIDNLPFFAAIATQAKGTTLIHDWTYEKRALYFTELDKLGATTLLADPHRIFIEGPSTLKPAELMCPPALRPATILLVAMLGAKGRSVLRNVYSINRGYEDIVTKLNSLGAKISILE